MLLTQLEYFVAVAREQHFGRAAASCFVSQSALSEAIRKLEVELRTPLVRRGRTFEGLTPEGERALGWARRMLADHDALRADLQEARGDLSADVRLATVPSALPQATGLVARIAAQNPHVHVRLSTGRTTEDIVRGLRHYELDAGLIHPGLDDEDLVLVPLAAEPVVVVGSAELLPLDAVPARALPERPLALLEPHMRARQILDTALEEAGVELSPRIECDSVDGLLALARTGSWVTAVPRGWTTGLELQGLRVVELREPEVTVTIALARLAGHPTSPVAHAVDRALKPPS